MELSDAPPTTSTPNAKSSTQQMPSNMSDAVTPATAAPLSTANTDIFTVHSKALHDDPSIAGLAIPAHPVGQSSEAESPPDHHDAQSAGVEPAQKTDANPEEEVVAPDSSHSIVEVQTLAAETNVVEAVPTPSATQDDDAVPTTGETSSARETTLNVIPPVSTSIEASSVPEEISQKSQVTTSPASAAPPSDVIASQAAMDAAVVHGPDDNSFSVPTEPEDDITGRNALRMGISSTIVEAPSTPQHSELHEADSGVDDGNGEPLSTPTRGSPCAGAADSGKPSDQRETGPTGMDSPDKETEADHIAVEEGPSQQGEAGGETEQDRPASMELDISSSSSSSSSPGAVSPPESCGNVDIEAREKAADQVEGPEEPIVVAKEPVEDGEAIKEEAGVEGSADEKRGDDALPAKMTELANDPSGTEASIDPVKVTSVVIEGKGEAVSSSKPQTEAMREVDAAAELVRQDASEGTIVPIEEEGKVQVKPGSANEEQPTQGLPGTPGLPDTPGSDVASPTTTTASEASAIPSKMVDGDGSHEEDSVAVSITGGLSAGTAVEAPRAVPGTGTEGEATEVTPAIVFSPASGTLTEEQRSAQPKGPLQERAVVQEVDSEVLEFECTMKPGAGEDPMVMAVPIAPGRIAQEEQGVVKVFKSSSSQVEANGKGGYKKKREPSVFTSQPAESKADASSARVPEGSGPDSKQAVFFSTPQVAQVAASALKANFSPRTSQTVFMSKASRSFADASAAVPVSPRTQERAVYESSASPSQADVSSTAPSPSTSPEKTVFESVAQPSFSDASANTAPLSARAQRALYESHAAPSAADVCASSPHSFVQKKSVFVSQAGPSTAAVRHNDEIPPAASAGVYESAALPSTAHAKANENGGPVEGSEAVFTFISTPMPSKADAKATDPPRTMTRGASGMFVNTPEPSRSGAKWNTTTHVKQEKTVFESTPKVDKVADVTWKDPALASPGPSVFVSVPQQSMADTSAMREVEVEDDNEDEDEDEEMTGEA